MNNMFYSFKTTSLIVVAMIFAANSTHAVTPATTLQTKTVANTDIKHTNFAPYLSLSGGYGSFQSMSNNTGNTGFARLGLGTYYRFSPAIAFGGELGIQSGKRAQINSATLAPFFRSAVDPLPVYATINPPIDVLATLKYHFTSPAFVQIKAGGVYLTSMIDGADIASNSEWDPELQVGIGFDMTKNTRLVLSYQRFFGQTLSLSQVNLNQGVAALANMPVWQAGLISLEMNF